jgi:hypothetical protein
MCNVLHISELLLNPLRLIESLQRYNTVFIHRNALKENSDLKETDLYINFIILLILL